MTLQDMVRMSNCTLFVSRPRRYTVRTRIPKHPGRKIREALYACLWCLAVIDDLGLSVSAAEVET